MKNLIVDFDDHLEHFYYDFEKLKEITKILSEFNYEINEMIYENFIMLIIWPKSLKSTLVDSKKTAHVKEKKFIAQL